MSRGRTPPTKRPIAVSGTTSRRGCDRLLLSSTCLEERRLSCEKRRRRLSTTHGTGRGRRRLMLRPTTKTMTTISPSPPVNTRPYPLHCF